MLILGIHMEGVPELSGSQHILAMKILFFVGAFLAAYAVAEADPKANPNADADADPWYSYGGYGGYGLGHGGYGYGGYGGHALGYRGYGYGGHRGYYGKRSADAEPAAEADAT